MLHNIFKLTLFTIITACLTGNSANAQPVLEMNEFATGFSNPTDIASDGGDRLFVVQRNGLIRFMDLDGNVNATPFMDITDRVLDAESEQGCLGLAFPPDFATSQVFYVNYTTGNGSGRTQVSRFSIDDMDSDKGDPDSEEVLLDFNQPVWNHNGGSLNFGPDGFLYVGVGDGGGAGDIPGNAQNRNTILGNILRIDVSGPTGYTIPDDNPYKDHANFVEEIWSWGLRNPWRFSFDRETGDMWIADVGQSAREEVNFEPAGIDGGLNYGWNCWEGAQTYPLGSNCNQDYTFPVFTYPHNSSTGGFSVTGGYVYRGALHPYITGDYIFCDYVSGNFWVTSRDDASGEWETTRQNNLLPFVSTFGEDPDGEIYAAQLSSGKIYKLGASCPDITFPVTISEEGDSLVADRTTGQFQWTFNGNPISGANNYYYTPTEDGDYAVEVIINDNGCVYYELSNSITYMNVVNAVFDRVERLDVYPNPVKDILRVNLGILHPEEILSWQLTNIAGSQFNVRSYFEDGAMMIDAKRLERGYYYLKLQTKDGTVAGRFMVR